LREPIAHETLELGDFPLRCGETLRDARLAYVCFGRLDAARSNVVVLPTAYGGTHLDNEWMIGAGRVLDPARWFIVAPNLFGAGLSSSPSRAHAAQSGPNFPHVDLYDNVAAQHRLVVDHFGATRIALVAGFSMGAQQAYHWAAFAPDFVERIAPICGSARTAEHNRVFLESIETTLRTDPAFANGAYTNPPLAGQRAVARVWAAWGCSQTFYREERWRTLGFETREAFVAENYDAEFGAADANDLLAMLHAWHSADIGSLERYAGNTNAALAAIRARAIVMPSRTDLYFPPEDSVLEVAAMHDAELAVIESVYGHAAGGGLDPGAYEFIGAQIARLLAACA
jgi:homoserine O-acetyltransferase